VDNNLHKKIAIYRCVIGDYDNIPSDIGKFNWCDRFLFTDRENLFIEGYKNINVPSEKNNALTNRKYKILVPDEIREYQISIYLDGNIAVNDSLLKLVKEFDSTNALLGLFEHHKHLSLGEEITSVLKNKKADLKNLVNEVVKLDSTNYLDRQVTDNSVLIRKHSQDSSLDRLMKEWFLVVQEGSHRDQLSLPVLLAKHQIPLHYFNKAQRTIFNGTFLQLPHRQKKFKLKSFTKSVVTFFIMLLWRIRW
jgi:hypothetical protein